MNIKQNISLQPYNTLGIDVNAAYFSSLNKAEDLQEIIHSDPWRSMPKLILGEGSNILLTQHYPGLIIKNELKGLNVIDENQDHIWITIAAGENWHEFVMHCVNNNYGGVENLSLIPGTAGAAPMQNIGAYGAEISAVFETLDTVKLSSGDLKTFHKNECCFGYRTSIFKTTHKNQYVITSITLRLHKKPQLNTSYGAIQSTLEKMSAKPSIQSISDAVIHIRKNKLPDPKDIPNAGSFFKNPLISKENFTTLKDKYPSIPHYPTDSTLVKIPAAWLIEQCGWKGKTVGNAGVHQHQALVLVNQGHANGADLKKLAEAIQQSVKDTFGITLAPEVNII